jgi:beta-carotene 15,15'-dioxygenase
MGNASVGWSPLPSDRLPTSVAAHWIITMGAFVAMMIGLPLGKTVVTLGLCVAVLLAGLPHGTLDLARVRQSGSMFQSFSIVALYLGLAAAMYAVWQIHSGLALLIFFGLSIAHFSEDWADRLPPLFAYATAMALVLAPVILHRADLEMLFGFLAGAGSSAVAIDVAILFAPIALAVAGVAVLWLWLDDHRQIAVSTGLAVTAMVFLPPLVGFALFFCLMHSPTQFSAGLARLGWQHDRKWLNVIMPMTVAALGISGAIFAYETALSLSQSFVVTAFVTLSILTLPHMIVPPLMQRTARRYGQRSV